MRDTPDAVVKLGDGEISYGDDIIYIGAADQITGIILRDNDPTVVSLSRADSGAKSEGSGANTVEFEVKFARRLYKSDCTGIADEVIQVPLAISGTGITADDFSLKLKTATGKTLSGDGLTLTGGASSPTTIQLRGATTLTPSLIFTGTHTTNAGPSEPEVHVVLTITDDMTDEGASETMKISLGPDGSGTNGFDRTSLATNVGGGADPHGTNNSFDVTINDNDSSEPTITIDGPSAAVTEGSNAVFTVSASFAPSSDLTVNLTVADATGADFIDDDTPTTVSLTGANADLIEGGNTASFTVSLNRALMTGETLAVPLSFAGTATRNTDYTTACASATGVTCANLNNGSATVTFAGAASAASTVTLTVTSATDVTDGETVIIALGTLGSGTGLDGGTEKSSSNTQVTFTLKDQPPRIIEDNDPTIVSLTRSGTGSVAEGSAVDLTVSLGRKLIAGEIIEVPLKITNTTTTDADWSLARKSGAGVTLTGTTVRFTGSGTITTSTVQTAVLTLLAAHDELTAESDETMTVAIEDGTSSGQLDDTGLATNVGGGVDAHGTNNSVALTITNNANTSSPRAPVVTIAPKSNAAITEGADAVFTVTADTAPSANLTVRLTVADAPNADFVSTANQGNQTVTITSGMTSVDYTVATVNDSGAGSDEPNDPITVTVRADTNSPAAYTVGSPDTASVTVNDNDATVSRLTGDATAIAEGTTKDFTVSIGRALRNGESLVVPLSFTGSATKGTDYTMRCASATGVACDFRAGQEKVTFSGSASGSATSVTATLSATTDSVTEASGETVNINLGTPTHTGLGGDAAATADNFNEFLINDTTGADDDATAQANPVSLSISADGAVTEGDAALTLTATLRDPAGAARRIPLRVRAAGTTTQDADYTVAASIAIATGAQSGTTTFTVTNDEEDEPVETVVVELGALPAGAPQATRPS